MKDWTKHTAKEVLIDSDKDGNRLISLFAKDYKEVMRTDICPSCNDFEAKFKNFLLKTDTMKKAETKNSGFVLKSQFENITLHGSAVYFNNENLTDAMAIELIENHPKGKGLFSVVPENLDALKKGSKKDDSDKNDKGDKAPKVPATVVVLNEREFTAAEAIEIFKESGVETKATSINGLQTKYDALTQEDKDALKLPTLDK